MSRYIFLTSFILSLCLGMYAQETEIQKRNRINEIKKDISFIFADATMSEKDEAVSLARDFLLSYVRQWYIDNKDIESFSKVEVDSSMDTIVTRRGVLYRVFAYYKIPGLDKNNDIKPVVEESIDLFDSIVSNIRSIDNITGIETFITQYVSNGQCIYGEIEKSTNPQSVNDSILVIYDKTDGSIVALLSPRSTFRINLKTLKKDSTSNYPGHGAKWIKVINK